MASRRSISEIEKKREALSLRGIEREYGYSREFVAEHARKGEITATPRGHALVILRSDFERWMRSRAIRPTAHADAIVERVLAREARRAGAG